ncbi:MAG TPA: EutN/CcmL family microcompartment protein [Clostridia bacterium]|nr:EutN/CcmL family microcompartment protein [Clostridia bacterium]
MIIARITGTVVCTQKDKSLVGKKMLVVQPVKIMDQSDSGSPFVALDTIGAGIGEIVMVVGGSSARMAEGFSTVPVDQSIVAIIDTIEVEGKQIFKKH